MQVGTTRDQGLYNKPSAAVHPGALAAGTLSQYSKSLYFLQVSMMLFLNKISSNKDALENVIWCIALCVFVGIFWYFRYNCKNFVPCRQRQRFWAKG